MSALPVPEPGVPLVEQTVCRRIVNDARCLGDLVRVGMKQAHGVWFYQTVCDRCGRYMVIPDAP